MNVTSASKTGTAPDETRHDDLLIKTAGPEDAPAIRALFKKIFAEDMSPAHWRWKYDRPQSRAIVIYKDNTLVAHYGGVGTGILREGKKSTAIQITDLMMDPSVRHTVRSRSPFYRSAATFLDRFVGYGKPFTYAYGFPSERAMKLSEKLRLYAPVGRLWEMTWQARVPDKNTRPDFMRIDAENFAGVEKRINRLWKKFGKRFRHHFAVEKDAGFFRWRYLEHPSRNYALYFFPGKLLGNQDELLVIRHDEHKSLLMDFMTGAAGYESIIGRARRLTALQGGRELLTWCTDEFRQRFRSLSADEKSLPIILPANIHSPGPAPGTQAGKWWLLPGDTDYL